MKGETNYTCYKLHAYGHFNFQLCTYSVHVLSILSGAPCHIRLYMYKVLIIIGHLFCSDISDSNLISLASKLLFFK